jgi:hypothetical protein
VLYAKDRGLAVSHVVVTAMAQQRFAKDRWVARIKAVRNQKAPFRPRGMAPPFQSMVDITVTAAMLANLKPVA